MSSTVCTPEAVARAQADSSVRANSQSGRDVDVITGDWYALAIALRKSAFLTQGVALVLFTAVNVNCFASRHFLDVDPSRRSLRMALVVAPMDYA